MNYFPEPKRNKPYKSLSDTYANMYQPIQEDVQIIGIPTGGTEQEVLGTIPDEYYMRLKRLVLSKGEGGTEFLVKKLLRLSDWEEIPDIDSRVLEIFLDYDINIEALLKIVTKKEKGKLGKIKSFLNKNDVWNLTDCLDSEVRNLTPQWQQLFADLTQQVQPKINTVSVGPGEVSLTLFTNATKGSVGDLQVDGQEIEIKGEGGRLGSSDYTKQINTSNPNKYLATLEPRGQHFSQVEGLQIQQKINALAGVAIDKLKNVEKTANKSVAAFGENPGEDETNVPGIFKQLQDKLQSLIVTSGKIADVITPESAKIEHDALNSYIDTANNNHHVNGAMTDAARKPLNGLLKNLTTLQTVNASKTDYNWQSSTQYMFNFDWDMTPREMAEAFVEMRTEQMESGEVLSLINMAEKVFKKKDVLKRLFDQKLTGGGGSKSHGQVFLQRLQTALMATSYQSAHGFPRLVVLNADTLQAANLKFDNTKDVGDRFMSLYKQLERLPQIHVSNPGVDSRNKGIGISVNA